jgi:hypothetical protein
MDNSKLIPNNPSLLYSILCYISVPIGGGFSYIPPTSRQEEVLKCVGMRRAQTQLPGDKKLVVPVFGPYLSHKENGRGIEDRSSLYPTYYDVCG